MGLTKLERRTRIKQRIRKVVLGTAEKPRLSVFRSNKEIYVQMIDDVNGQTLMAVSSREKSIKGDNNTKIATAVGKLLGERATEKGITTCSFDRNGYLYHGRVKALAEAARKEGLKF